MLWNLRTPLLLHLLSPQLQKLLLHSCLLPLVLFFVAGFLPGLAWLMIAFLISPYGLPLAAAWLVGIIGGANSALKDFIFG